MEFGGARQAAVVSGRFDETIYVASAVSLLLCQGLDLWNDAGLAGRKGGAPVLGRERVKIRDRALNREGDRLRRGTSHDARYRRWHGSTRGQMQLEFGTHSEADY